MKTIYQQGVLLYSSGLSPGRSDFVGVEVTMSTVDSLYKTIVDSCKIIYDSMCQYKLRFFYILEFFGVGIYLGLVPHL